MCDKKLDNWNSSKLHGHSETDLEQSQHNLSDSHGYLPGATCNP